MEKDCGMIDLNNLDLGFEWKEPFKSERMLSCFEHHDGYLYVISGGGDNTVERFSVVIGVWGQADIIR